MKTLQKGFVGLLLVGSLLGCNEEPSTPAETATAPSPLPECNPPPDYTNFSMVVCPRYTDVGTCVWSYGDGRQVPRGDCWNQDGTCLWSCDEVTP